MEYIILHSSDLPIISSFNVLINIFSQKIDISHDLLLKFIFFKWPPIPSKRNSGNVNFSAANHDRGPQHYLTLAEFGRCPKLSMNVMNDALCRGAWDKGCTDIMYMTTDYPKYPIISLLTQQNRHCVNVLRRRN